MTLRQFADQPPSVPAATAWFLADVMQALGKQELFTRQAPQRLKALREHALIQSAVASNRIEGVEVEPSRVGTIVFGRSVLRDRDEEEVRGYRKALDLIHSRAAALSVTEATIRRLHALSRGGLGDAGEYKQSENDIIEVLPGGRRQVRFRPVRAANTSAAMAELVALLTRVHEQAVVHPLIALAAFSLDFLCVHPFRDGNGRTSRLLLLLTAFHAGLEVGRYISLERLIELSKERYYETLKLSSAGWHEGKHDPWPHINFLLFTLREAYQDFEQRMSQTVLPRGAKTALVLAAIERRQGTFQAADLQRDCPGVGLDLIRRVLKQKRQSGQLECLARGPKSLWQKTNRWNLGNTEISGY